MEHTGFGTAVAAAVRTFAEHFGLEAPQFPPLNPEFENPLYLKLVCEMLQATGRRTFPLGAASLRSVNESFLADANRKISRPDACDLNEHDHVVQRAVEVLATKVGHDVFTAAEANEVLQAVGPVSPPTPWSKSLLPHLEAAGVLYEASPGEYAFAYERMRDLARASVLVRKPREDLREWLRDLGSDRFWFGGVLEALAMAVPETISVELPDLVADGDDDERRHAERAFLSTLSLRSSGSMTSSTQDLVLGLLSRRGHSTSAVWNELLRLAPVVDHPLNADWLHQHLLAMSLPERDASWSEFLVEGTNSRAVLRNIIDWAWPQAGGPPAANDETARLVGTALGWALSSTDRRVRDRSTKAMVSLLEGRAELAATILCSFVDVNDPWILERLAAVACGLSMRSDSVQEQRVLGEAIVDLFGGTQPVSLLARDYANRVIERAKNSEWVPKQWIAPEVVYPSTTRTYDELNAQSHAAGFEFGSIMWSIDGLGDFGEKIVKPALDHFEGFDQELRQLGTVWILERVIELGWTKERFKQLDTRRSWQPHAGDVVERYGKKYQWIAFMEFLGRLSLHRNVKSWDGTVAPYTNFEQVFWRDIDPTLLSRKPEKPAKAASLWFSPGHGNPLNGSAGQWPANADEIPDPLPLIEVEQLDGRRWLALEAQPEWSERVPKHLMSAGQSHQRVWMQIRSYLVEATALPTLKAWLASQTWEGRWMPDANEPYNLLFAGHPHDYHWESASGELEEYDWNQRMDGCPRPMWMTAAWYSGTGTDRDQSGARETYGLVPSAKMNDVLGLRSPRDFTWRDSGGGIAAMDASVISGGPATLVVDRELLQNRLAEAGLAIWWSVLSNTDLVHPGGEYPDEVQWVTASASYVLGADCVERVSASAEVHHNLRGTLGSVDWL